VFNHFNYTLNVIMAILFMTFPHLMRDNGLTPEKMRTTMLEAERHAQKIVETGDASELQELETAVAELDKYRPMLEKIEPVMEKVTLRLGFDRYMIEASAGNDSMKTDLRTPEKTPQTSP
jgi:hypothetical protein